MKNSDLLHYKGYSARPEYSAEDRIFYGTILGISDMVDFQSENSKDLEEEFHKAVDEYLEFCKEIGKEPQKEYNGLFNVRIPPELHRQLSQLAQAEGRRTGNSSDGTELKKSKRMGGELHCCLRLPFLKLLASGQQTGARITPSKSRLVQRGAPE